jgi:small-conductance mechanosensitive channel
MLRRQQIGTAPYPFARNLVQAGLLLLVGAWVVLVGESSAVRAAEAAGEPASIAAFDKLTPQERLALLARLSDAQVRELLLRELQARAGASGATEPQARLASTESLAANIRQNLADILEQAGDLPTVIPFALTRLADGDDTAKLLAILASTLFMLAGGVFAEWFFRRATRAARRRSEFGSGAKLGRLSLRLLLDLLALAIFALAASACFGFTYYGLKVGRSETSLTFALVYLGALMIVRLASALARFLLAPNAPALRLVAVSDDSASYLHRWMIAITALTSFGFLTCELLLMIVGFVVTGALVMMIWHGRRRIAELVRGGGDTPASQLTQMFADVWHVLAIAYVIALYGCITIARLAGQEPGIGVWAGSLLVVIAVPVVDAAVRHGVGHFLFAQRDRDDESGSIREYQAILVRALRLVLVVVSVMALASLWGVDIFSAAQTQVGPNVARAGLDIVLTLIMAYVAWGVAKIAIDHRLALEQDPLAETDGDAEAGGTGVSRLRTLLPLLRRFLQITIAVMVTMIVLSSLGVNIGPLIAGAGVVGLAVGFGAQTLVRDIVSGMFFLLDDAFRLGEYVDIGSVKGRVEAIHVRSLVLRHHHGPLHTVPFGEIKRLTNFSRDWVIMKFEFRVPFDTDINKVKKLFKQIGADLLAHERFGPSFIEPFKSQGVTDLDDSAMIVRAKFKAIPEKQYEIRKEVYARVQKAFQDNGIKFAHRRVMVDLPPGVDGAGPYGKALTDAAAAALATDAKAVADRSKG